MNRESNLSLPPQKTGEICADGGQCISSICFPLKLTDEQKINLAKSPLKNIVGTCYLKGLATGCVKQILKGTISKEFRGLHN